MISQYKYTDKEMKEILKKITIIADTREQKNSHILSYLNEKKIPYISQALNYGDYSYMLPASASHGIQRDLYFTGDIIFERKADLDELSGNLAQKREQFENEFLRAGNSKKYLIIERGSYTDMFSHNYSTKLSEKAFIASIMALQHRYNINVSFVDEAISGAFIYAQCYYHLREFLKSNN